MAREWLKSRFLDQRLRSAKLSDTLLAQPYTVRQAKAALTGGDSAALATALDALDAELLRFACAHLWRSLEEAAREDCAFLIASSVLETADPAMTAERWVKWLETAPLWPALAQKQWARSLDAAVKQVLQALEADGLDLAAEVEAEIEQAITNLKPADLLPPETVAQFFTPLESAETTQW